MWPRGTSSNINTCNEGAPDKPARTSAPRAMIQAR
jgi:hypothetical protein